MPVRKSHTVHAFVANMCPDRVYFPKNSSRAFDITQNLGPHYYKAVLELLQEEWAGKISLVATSDYQTPGVTFFGKVRSFSHVYIRGLRYGSVHEHRGKAGCYGYIDKRVPVLIERIFHVTQRVADDSDEELTSSFAVVRRFQRDGHLPELPWDRWCVYSWSIYMYVLMLIHRASDLGTATWYAQSFNVPELVMLERFSGHLVIAPVTIQHLKTWITVPFDHVSSERICFVVAAHRIHSGPA
jgi:hypothetical protein